MDVKELRRSLGLSQSQFAKQYGIPVSTIKNWEQGIRTPDGAPLSYLKVIKKMPAAVADALK